jgi:hypothetical protein
MHYVNMHLQCVDQLLKPYSCIWKSTQRIPVGRCQLNSFCSGQLLFSFNFEVSDAEREMKIAGEDREKQNMMFQQTVADQRATVELLNQVRGCVMSG